jgi:glucose/arabinose dehydrogenase
MHPVIRHCAALLLLAIGLPVGGCGKSEIVSLPWADATVETLATLDNPWAMTFLPDGRLLITEKPGNLRIYADGKLSEPIGGVPKVEYHEQGGLLDVAVDPDFATNQLVYLSYTEASLEQPADAKDEGDDRLGPYQDLNDVVLKGLGGLSSEALIVLTIKGNTVMDDSIVRTERRIRDVAQMPDGSLLLLTDGNNAELLRLIPSSETTG